MTLTVFPSTSSGCERRHQAAFLRGRSIFANFMGPCRKNQALELNFAVPLYLFKKYWIFEMLQNKDLNEASSEVDLPKDSCRKKKHLKRGKASTNGCKQGILDCQVSLLGDKWSRKPRRNGRAKIRHHTKTLQLAHSGVMFVKGKPMLQLG